jgi:FAD:protein FMN transferase
VLALAEAQRAPQTWVEFSFFAMGTENTVLIGDGPESINDMCTYDWLIAEVERLEQTWSRFRPDSELNRFLAAVGPQRLSDDLLLALDCAARLFAATGGLYDARIRTHLDTLGYSQPFRSLPTCDNGQRIGAPISVMLPEMMEDHPGFSVDLVTETAELFEDVTLDLGGVGKGLAADMLARSISMHGAGGVCVSMGGDIRAIGVGPYDGGWHIPVNAPYATSPSRTHFLIDGAMVMSTTALRTWTDGSETNKRTYNHLIDPRTGESIANGIESVAAVGETAWWSEGIAKAALLAGPSEAIELLERCGVDGWVFLESGAVLTTSLL